MSNLSSRLQQTIVFLFYFLFLALPLIWTQNNSELFEVPKMITVYGLTIVIGGLWLGRMVIEKRFILQRSAFDPIFLAFILSQVISTIISIHPHTSIFGFYSRLHGGLLSTVCYLVLFYAFVSNLDRQEGLRSVAMLISSSVINALVAFPEHFGYAFSCLIIEDVASNKTIWERLIADCWVQDIVTRIFGTFGQPNWLAAFLITIQPLIWGKLAIKSYLQPLLRPSIFWLSLVNSLLFSTLLFTRSRSGLVGIALALGLFVILHFIFIWRSKLQQSFKSSVRVLALLAVSMGIPLLIFGSEYTPSFTQIAQGFSQRSLNMDLNQDVQPEIIPSSALGGTKSSEIRQIVWKGAWNMFMDNLLFGTGVETFAYAYYAYRPVEHNLISEWDFLYNKAHNEFLNVASTTGIFGIMSYLGIIATMAFLVIKPLVWRVVPKTKSQPDLEVSLLLIALLAGYVALAASNFFGFSTVVVGLLFFIYPALVVVLASTKPQQVVKTIKSSSKVVSKQVKLSTYQVFGLLALVGTAFVLELTLGRYYYGDLVYAQADSAEQGNDLNQALSKYREAITYRPYEALYYNDYADTLSKAAFAQATAGDAAATNQFAAEAFKISSETLQLNPRHINFYKTQAGVFIRLSPLDIALLDVAESILSDAAMLAPTDAKVVYNLGLIKLDQEATDSAQSHFEHAIQLKANYEGARMELAEIYINKGETDKAIEQYQYILNFIAPGNTKAREALEELEAEGT